ncbi:MULTISPECIES: maleylpyruvate isomerase family mycothiol-dependent enzyme [unclassified Luteococcus]|uniref:maleylpyruvate isomerase family mycothiol-dependent enzyme n=1 Tax=unclassified Luteococcus TaxID=2639923 RepID=UPI00313B1CE7
MDLFSAIASERRSLADLLEPLTPDQQQAQSLCSEWTVKQVAAHLVMPMEVGMFGFMTAMLRHRGNFDAANDALAKKQAQRPFPEIVQILRDKADHRFTPPGQGPEAPLTDVIVHGLDITTPLGLSHPIPDEHLVVTWDYLAEPSPKARAASRQLDGCVWRPTTSTGATAPAPWSPVRRGRFCWPWRDVMPDGSNSPAPCPTVPHEETSPCPTTKPSRTVSASC